MQDSSWIQSMIFFLNDILSVPLEIEYNWDSLFLGFPGGSDGKEPACNAKGPDLIPWSGRSTGERNGSSIPFLESSMDRGAWEVHGATKTLVNERISMKSSKVKVAQLCPTLWHPEDDFLKSGTLYVPLEIKQSWDCLFWYSYCL